MHLSQAFRDEGFRTLCPEYAAKVVALERQRGVKACFLLLAPGWVGGQPVTGVSAGAYQKRCHVLQSH